jgi:hypothetical protein
MVLRPAGPMALSRSGRATGTRLRYPSSQDGGQMERSGEPFLLPRKPSNPWDMRVPLSHLDYASTVTTIIKPTIA